MKSYILLLICFIAFQLNAQVDYSNQWEDVFSYNNVKDIIKVDDLVFALSDNAVFTYNTQTQDLQKLSSINGLSGETTSTMHYNAEFKRLVIGYDNGLLEVVDNDGRITIAPDIVNFNQVGLKRINSIFEYGNNLYLATPFAIIVYNIERLEFGDTYFIGAGSTDVNINDITVFNNTIFAATSNGIYEADVGASNLIDATNWTLRYPGDFQHITLFNNAVYTVSNQTLYRLNGMTLEQLVDFSGSVIDIKSSTDRLIVSLINSVVIYNESLTQIAQQTISPSFDFSLNTATIYDNNVFLGTTKFGILSSGVGSQSYTEIHPEGPLSNAVFSLAAHNHNLWLVYGGYDATYAPVQRRDGFTHFNGITWVNIEAYNNQSFGDLVDITIDKNHDNRVFISSFGDTNAINTLLTGGLYEVVDDNITRFYNHLNSPLEDIEATNANRVTIRISGTVFDREGNLWVSNLITNERLKKLSASGSWTGYDINELFTASRAGIGEVVIDNSNSIWMATRGNGVTVYNENGNRKRALTTQVTRGSLPNMRIESIAVDQNNRIWIGTLTGLVVYNNASDIFDASIFDAEPIVILDDGIAKRLLGDQTINAIEVDGANNKWFGTGTGGVLFTNPNGQTTLANFNKDNSPLPSNRVLEIAVDEVTGKVYFATDKGVVAYNSSVAPYGDELTEVYAYPNPVLKHHDRVTITGLNGGTLPEGTNVKILDAAGNLVYESNVVEGEELFGGSVVWNKRNLAGRKVASGIYIVLLSTEDGTESSTTKIAIVN